MHPFDIRDERDQDAAAIEAVTRAAFGTVAYSSGTEQFIVRALREAGCLSVSLVATEDGVVVGHAGASPVGISGGAAGWHGLGPVSVAPGHQGRGIGTRLVVHVLDALRTAGSAGCVVLGEPSFYGRFGFRTVPGLVLPGVPAEYFQALPFGHDLPAGTVAYLAAFEATG